MAKGDDSRARNKIDEQQKLAQGYLTGLQSSLANQSGNMGSFYAGNNSQYGVGPSASNMYGYGSTVPQFSWTGQPYFQGNGTDSPTTSTFNQQGGNNPLINEQSFRNLFGGSNQISSDQLWNMRDRIAQMGGQVMTNAAGQHGKIKLANGEIVDVIGGMGGGGGTGSLQWNSDQGGGAAGFGGGIPGLTLGAFGDIMGGYGDLVGDYKNLYGQLRGDYSPFLGAASDMAKTGGLSAEDQANIRARAISPIRAVYENSLRNVDRQRAIQGGYSPGYTTAMGRFNREMGQGVSDATTNAEAAIAELVQKGKLGGLSAWGGGLGGQTSGLLGALGGAGNALGGMTSLYGATPGMASTFGNQALAANQQQLTAAGLQSQLGLGTMENQTRAGQLPGKFQSAMGNIGSAVNLAGDVAGAVYPWLGAGRTPDLGMGTTVTPGTSYGYAGGTGIDPNSMFWGT